VTTLYLNQRRNMGTALTEREAEALLLAAGEVLDFEDAREAFGVLAPAACRAAAKIEKAVLDARREKKARDEHRAILDEANRVAVLPRGDFERAIPKIRREVLAYLDTGWRYTGSYTEVGERIEIVRKEVRKRAKKLGEG